MKLLQLLQKFVPLQVIVSLESRQKKSILENKLTPENESKLYQGVEPLE